MENNIQTQAEQVKEWFTTTEFAEVVGVNKRTLNFWLSQHPNFVAKHCKNRAALTSTRPRYSINYRAIVDYTTNKNSFNGNQHVKKEMVTNPIENAKAIVSENALQNMERQQSQLTPIQALLQAVQAMAGMEQRMEAQDAKLIQLEHKIEQATEVLTSPVAMTDGQRKFLNDRVRAYCAELDIPHYIVWRQIHDHVGIHKLESYQLRHYRVAFEYVKKMYVATGLTW